MRSKRAHPASPNAPSPGPDSAPDPDSAPGPGRDSADDSALESGRDAAEDSARGLGQDSARAPVREPAQDPALGSAREAAHDLAHLLGHAERRMVRRLNSVLEKEGCSVEQWRVMSAVADGTGRPMTEIAEYALLPAPSLTKLVDRMVTDNLVYRRPDPDDRRRVLLHLAPRGRILHQRAAHRLAEDEARLGAPGEDAELAALAQALDLLSDALDSRRRSRTG